MAYVAPEQSEGEEIDPRADLYALGVMLYELVTGQLPFTGSAIHIIIKHIQEMPQSPKEISPELPSALDELIMHLLQKKPNDRPDSAESVGHLLGILGDLYRMAFVH